MMFVVAHPFSGSDRKRIIVGSLSFFILQDQQVTIAANHDH